MEETVWPRRVLMFKPGAMGKTELACDLGASFDETFLPSNLMLGRDRLLQKTAEANEARERWLEDRLQRLLAKGAQRDEIVVEHHPDCVTVIVWKGVPRYRHEVTFGSDRF